MIIGNAEDLTRHEESAQKKAARHFVMLGIRIDREQALYRSRQGDEFSA